MTVDSKHIRPRRPILISGLLLAALTVRCSSTDETDEGHDQGGGIDIEVTSNTGGSGHGGGPASTGTSASGTASSGGAPATSGTGGSGCAKDEDCDDRDACTTDNCEAGSCKHDPVSTDDNDACTMDLCDPTTGPVHGQLGTDDGDPCTIDDCDSMTGVSHAPVNINDGDACTIDFCDLVTGVLHEMVNLDDNDVCTMDHCDPVMGVVHVAIDPNDDDACTADACDPVLGVSHTPVNIDDGDACTTDSCGPVTGILHATINTNDGNACTDGSCDPVTGVVQAPVTCNDNNPCTADACNPATGCVFAPIVYFSETFADNSKGWALGANWQIGPEIANPAVPPPPLANPDPTTDHTPTADNGVAGVLIGENLANVVQGPYFLTSPVINLSTAPGSVTLEYWRYLNSDDPPYMNSTIDVFDGSGWVQIYSVPANGASPQPRDAAWTKIQYDVSAQATGNGNFRIRWGHQVLSKNALPCSSWNVDDIRIVPGAPGFCP